MQLNRHSRRQIYENANEPAMLANDGLLFGVATGL